MRRAVLVLVATAAVSLALDAHAEPAALPDGSYYQSADGTLVHGPTHPESAAFGPVAATCRDQHVSYAHARRGACARHNGVSSWRQ